MPISIDHPLTLAFVTLCCVPTLFPLARFFFDDFETFLHDLGYRRHDDIWWKFMRISISTETFPFGKAALFIACFVILVGLTYHTVVKFFY